MTLIAEAEKAEDIADALAKFKVAVDDHATVITALVSELYAVGSALREIDTAVYSPEYGNNLNLIEADLDNVRRSLEYTLDDVFRILGRIGQGAEILSSSAYRLTWKEIARHFESDARGGLLNRVEVYRQFLILLCNRIRKSVGSRSPTLIGPNSRAGNGTSRVSLTAFEVTSVDCSKTKIGGQWDYPKPRPANWRCLVWVNVLTPSASDLNSSHETASLIRERKTSKFFNLIP